MIAFFSIHYLIYVIAVYRKTGANGQSTWFSISCFFVSVSIAARAQGHQFCVEGIIFGDLQRKSKRPPEIENYRVKSMFFLCHRLFSIPFKVIENFVFNTSQFDGMFDKKLSSNELVFSSPIASDENSIHC